jgi:CRISPR-associated endoribonuclease Cas6
MKLKIEFSKNTEPVTFGYVSNLNGYLHKVLGSNNEYHDDISLYSTSFLHGGKISRNKKYFEFPNGAVWYVSSPDKVFIQNFINNVFQNISFAFGMELQGVVLVQTELREEDGYYLFHTKSPILLKQRDFETKKNIYFTYEDDIKTTSELMKSVILKKAEKASVAIKNSDFDIFFNYEYPGKKIKWIKIKTVNNKTSVCPIYVKTNNLEIAKFIYDIGVGHSTGSGFGFLL